MTKKLVWRLGKLPTPLEVADLMNHKIITQEEAHEILFSSESEEDRDKESLQSEIKFLRELVEKLSSNQSKVVEIIRTIEKPYYRWEWYQPYQIWCTNKVATSGGYTFTSGTNVTSTSANNNSFSNIKTF